VEIHVRSVFLQGLLAASGTERWPSVAGVEPQELIDALDGLVERFGRVDRADLCVAFVQANPAVSRLVLGVDTPEQLLANAELVRRPPLDADQVAEVERAFAALPEDLLNPALWPR
jgi:aryl-alcohol dehydrogenase-like predicted oxidoreductase